MTVLTLDSVTAERLKAMHGEVQLCDPQGVIVGRAIAVGETLPFEVPFTREELEASERQEGGCTLTEALYRIEMQRVHGGKLTDYSFTVPFTREELEQSERKPGGKPLAERLEELRRAYP